MLGLKDKPVLSFFGELMVDSPTHFEDVFDDKGLFQIEDVIKLLCNYDDILYSNSHNGNEDDAS